MNTDTPRTETYVLNPHPESVPAEFAREIERELAASKAEVERLLERAENAEADLIRTQIEMQLDLDKSEEEVERLKKELAAWDYGNRAEREQKRAEKAEEEVERLREQLAKAHEELCQAGLREYGN
jgi:Skp family chaperone for outer membrane proteins